MKMNRGEKSGESFYRLVWAKSSLKSLEPFLKAGNNVKLNKVKSERTEL